MSEIKHTKRSWSALDYNLVLSTRNTIPVIDQNISEFLKQKFLESGKPYHLKILKWSYEPSYLRIQFSAEPTLDISRLVQTFKTSTSKQIRSRFPEKINDFPKQGFWSRAYIITTHEDPLNQNLEDFLEFQKYASEEIQKNR